MTRDDVAHAQAAENSAEIADLSERLEAAEERAEGLEADLGESREEAAELQRQAEVQVGRSPDETLQAWIGQLRRLELAVSQMVHGRGSGRIARTR